MHMKCLYCNYRCGTPHTLLFHYKIEHKDKVCKCACGNQTISGNCGEEIVLQNVLSLALALALILIRILIIILILILTLILILICKAVGVPKEKPLCHATDGTRSLMVI